MSRARFSLANASKHFITNLTYTLSTEAFVRLLIIHFINYFVDTALFVRVTRSTELFSFYLHSRMELTLSLLLNIVPIVLLVSFISQLISIINLSLVALNKLLLLFLIYPLIINNDIFGYRQYMYLIVVILASFYLLANRIYVISKNYFISQNVDEEHRYGANYIFNFFQSLAVALGTLLGFLSSIKLLSVAISTYLLLICLSVLKLVLSLKIKEKKIRGGRWKVNLFDRIRLRVAMTENIFFRVLFGYLLTFSIYHNSHYAQLRYMSLALIVGSFLNLFIQRFKRGDAEQLLDLAAVVVLFTGTSLLFTHSLFFLILFAITLGCSYSFGRVMMDMLLQREVYSSKSKGGSLILIAQCDNLLHASWLIGIFLFLISTYLASLQLSMAILYLISFFFLALITYFKLHAKA
jgi:hypothetical protein